MEPHFQGQCKRTTGWALLNKKKTAAEGPDWYASTFGYKGKLEAEGNLEADDASTVASECDGVLYFSSVEIRDIEKIEALLADGKSVDCLQKEKISQKCDLLKQKQPFLDKMALGWVARPQ